VVNVRNDGTLPFLPDDAVIEVPARVDGDGVRPLPLEPLDPLYAGLVGHVTAYEDLALEAALHGGRERVFQALLAHPLVGQVDLAEGLTDRLIAHNRDHLAWV
jgi:6-phospho-beta-glucosidase